MKKKKKKVIRNVCWQEKKGRSLWEDDKKVRKRGRKIVHIGKREESQRKDIQ